MSYKVDEIDNKRVVHLNGEIDMEVSDKARNTILPLIEAGHEVQINLSKVDYMDSSGISVLIESHQKALENNTKVIVKEVSKSVLKVIMMAKLEQILKIHMQQQQQCKWVVEQLRVLLTYLMMELR